MSIKPPTVWMNVTTSFYWKRPPVGILRVEQSLSSELAKLYGSQFKQCIWQNDRFIEYIPQSEPSHCNTADKNTQIESYSSKKPKASTLPMIFPIITRRQALNSIGQALLSLTPARFRPPFNRVLYFLRPYIGRLLAFIRRINLSSRLQQQTSILIANADTSIQNSVTNPFSEGDILISVGLDWDYAYNKQFFTLRKNSGIKIVTCCYDLIPVLYPQYCVAEVAGIFTSYFLDLADASDLILCISNQSEKDLRHLLYNVGGATSKTHVFPLGDNVPVASTDEIDQKINKICQEPFILFVSTIERRKNHEVLYRAYHLLCSQGKRADLPKLVFVGMQGWGVSELMKDIELDPLIKGLIINLNHVNDTELHVLYKSAQFCVFPSLYEGWGLPVGEALSMGKVVLCSNRGSLPEVGGELVKYLDPWNPYAWADELYKLITNSEYRTELELRVKEQYNPRQWHEAAVSIKNAIDLTCKNL